MIDWQRGEEIDSSFKSLQEREKELPPPSLNGLFRGNSILAYFSDPQYRRKSEGITKYGTTDYRDAFNPQEDLIEYRGVKDVKPKYQMQMKVDPFLFIPEEVYIYLTGIFFHNGTEQ